MDPPAPRAHPPPAGAAQRGRTLSEAEDPDLAFRRLLAAVRERRGALDPEVTRRALRNEPLPEPLGGFAAKLARGDAGPRDVEALRRSGYSEDAVFELTVSAVFGWAKARLDAGLRALQEAEA